MSLHPSKSYPSNVDPGYDSGLDLLLERVVKRRREKNRREREEKRKEERRKEEITNL